MPCTVNLSNYLLLVRPRTLQGNLLLGVSQISVIPPKHSMELIVYPQESILLNPQQKSLFLR